MRPFKPKRAGDAQAGPLLELTAKRSGVTRYSPYAIGGVGVIGFLAFAGAAWLGLHSPKAPTARAEEPASKPEAAAAQIPPGATKLGGYADPNGPLNRSPAVPTTSADGTVAGTSAGQAGAAGTASPATTPPQPSPEVQRRLEMAQAARTSSPFFGGEGQGGGATGERPLPVQSSGPAFGPPAAPPETVGEPRPPVPLPASAVQNMQAEKQAFVAGASIKGDYLASPYLRPLSPYEIKAGAIIPAALVTGLNSDLPGEIVAQVTENVFDHASGRRVLIPQGARLFGRYDSQVASGQDRILIVWNRIIMPDGRSINIGSMTGTDIRGESGLQDRVDSHIGPLTRAVALATAITVGGSIAQNASTRSSGNLVLNDAAGGVAASASQVGQRFIDRDLNRQPTLRVRPGWPLRVLVNRDIVLEPY